VTALGEHPRMGPGRGRLAGKVAIVSGADQGIGRATARLFAREGAAVVCADLRPAELARPADAPRVDGLVARDGAAGQGSGRAIYVEADAGVADGWRAVLETAQAEFGRVDILVNNAGFGIRAKLHELSEDAWHAVLRTNLDSVFHGVRAVLPLFERQGGGVIVNNASSFGLLATDAYAAYCASKAAVINLTRQLAIDYGPSIRVNCVCPGATVTPRLEERIAASADPAATRVRMDNLARSLRRMAAPEEIAYAILFLASDEASFVTGHALAVDGGQTIDA
jgi:NAD(P)-dependent dehydrogenase (short-subunit alcohol dehydrogenase family)